ncbi:MAG: Do family serine endopeptidase, partial [Verrucomicrobiales bacterium]|nr:Do family serine endopeptidase [Verrucomicrobiales bacterium]
AVLFGIWSLELGIRPAPAQDWWPFGKKRTEVTVSNTPVSRETRISTSYAPIVKLVAPSVVTIKTKRNVKTGGDLRQAFPGLDDDPPPAREQGSGVIVTSDGFILTNNHVVAGQDRISVYLPDSTAEYDAKLIGADAKSDIAVLKINARDLPAATLGDSNLLEVGDVVLAIGNPFNIGQTVTMGIVSGLGRNRAQLLGSNSYENFIQTDASINSGNSGGPLVDTEGRLVGINTAIISPNGGNLGIGFAIPANMARFIMEQLITHGKVTRGYLGVQIQDLDPEMAESYGRGASQGVLVTKVENSSAAERGGLRRGDIITAVNDEPVRDAQALRLAISSLAPGTSLKITHLRDGADHTVSVILGRLPDESVTSGGGAPMPDNAADGDNVSAIKSLGIDIQAITSDLRRKLNLRDPGGVVVTKINPNSVAADKGIRPGAVILEINDKPVAAVKDALDAVRQSKPTVRLYVWINGMTHYVALKKTGD